MSPNPTQFIDACGNTYFVDKAWNGRHIAVRVNPGGNRKRLKCVPATPDRNAVQRALDLHAERSNWRPLDP